MNDKKPNITQPKKQQTIAPKNIDEAMLLFQQDTLQVFIFEYVLFLYFHQHNSMIV